MRAFMRGHPISWDGEEWRYADGAICDDSRRCVECDLPHEPTGPDVCIGYKPGVTSVCCTHGGRMPAIYYTHIKQLTA